MKNLKYLLFIPIIFILPLAAQAHVVKSSDFIYIAKDEIVEGNLYFRAKSLNIEGQVLGDVIGVASNIQINGKVSGDIISLAQNINIKGEVDGNVRVMSNILNISGNIKRNINFLGESLIMESESLSEKDILFKSINSEFKGKTQGNLYGQSHHVLIAGEVGGDVNIELDRFQRKNYLNLLSVKNNAIISGSLNYQSGNDAIIETENISGEINKRMPTKNKSQVPNPSKLLFLIVSNFIVALLLSFLFKKKMKSIQEIIITKNYGLLGYGAIILFLTPIVALILLVTVIGAPIAIMSLALWGILLFLSSIVTAMAIGKYLFQRLKKEAISEHLQVLAGITILLLLVSLPYIGWLFSLTAMLMGLGSCYYIIKNKKYDKN